MKRRLLPALILAAGLVGCAQHFPISDLTSDERLFEETLRSDQSSDAKLALAQMYFTHNRIDEADTILGPLVKAEPKNAQAAAWYGANNCKKAARRGPWLMGLDKLYLVKSCLDEVEQALASASDDFVVQMVHMNNGAEVDVFGSLERAKSTKIRVEKSLTANPKILPNDAQAQFYVTAAKIERKAGNASKAATYLDRAATLEAAEKTRKEIDAERQKLVSK